MNGRHRQRNETLGPAPTTMTDTRVHGFGNDGALRTGLPLASKRAISIASSVSSRHRKTRRATAPDVAPISMEAPIFSGESLPDVLTWRMLVVVTLSKGSVSLAAATALVAADPFRLDLDVALIVAFLVSS